MRFWMTLATAGLLAGCGDKDNDSFGGTTADPGTTETDSTDTDGGTSSTDSGATDDTGDTGTASAPDGAALYDAHCASCHGPEGEGVQDVGPGLAGEFSRHSDEQLVDVVLNGDGDMPPIAVTEDEAYTVVEWLRAFFEG